MAFAHKHRQNAADSTVESYIMYWYSLTQREMSGGKYSIFLVRACTCSLLHVHVCICTIILTEL